VRKCLAAVLILSACAAPRSGRRALLPEPVRAPSPAAPPAPDAAAWVAASSAGAPDAAVEDPPRCRAGSLAEVLRCRALDCPSRAVHDATPLALSKLGWHVVLCEEGPQEDAFGGEALGFAWLYGGTASSLSYAKDLATLGGTAKYYNDARFSVIRARERTVGERRVLWLECLVAEHLCGGAFNGCIDSRTVTVTLCRPEAPAEHACGLHAILTASKRFTPYAQSAATSPPWSASATFDVELSAGGVDIAPKSTSGDATSLPVTEPGHHDWW
jgi:hypothetical protein